jgi:hypothetical protein
MQRGNLDLALKDIVKSISLYIYQDGNEFIFKSKIDDSFLFTLCELADETLDLFIFNRTYNFRGDQLHLLVPFLKQKLIRAMQFLQYKIDELNCEAGRLQSCL